MTHRRKSTIKLISTAALCVMALAGMRCGGSLSTPELPADSNGDPVADSPDDTPVLDVYETSDSFSGAIASGVDVAYGGNLKAWTYNPAFFATAGGVLQITTSAASWRIASLSGPTSHCTVELTAADLPTTMDAAAVIFRYASGFNFWAYRASKAGQDLVKMVGGASTVVASGAGINSGDVLKVSLVGDQIATSVNGVAVLAVQTDSDLNSNTGYGIAGTHAVGAGQTDVDDFRLYGCD